MRLHDSLLPPLALATLALGQTLDNLWPAAGLLVRGVMLMLAVLAAVHHAEVVAHRTGEPMGTLVLALAVTVIEVALILSLMRTASAGQATLALLACLVAVVGLAKQLSPAIESGLRHWARPSPASG